MNDFYSPGAGYLSVYDDLLITPSYPANSSQAPKEYEALYIFTHLVSLAEYTPSYRPPRFP